MRQISKLTEL